MRRETKVNVLALVQQSRSLVVDTSVERSVRVVARDNALEIHGEVGSLRQVIDANGVEVVPTVGTALGTGRVLVDVRLGGEIPSVGGRVDHTGGGTSDVRVDVDT